MGSAEEAAPFGLRLALTLANARRASSTSTASDTTRGRCAGLSSAGPPTAPRRASRRAQGRRRLADWTRRDEALDRLEEVFGPSAICPLKRQIESQQSLHILTALGTVRQDVALQPAQIPEAETLSLGEPIHEYAQRRDMHVRPPLLASHGRRVARARMEPPSDSGKPGHAMIEKMVGKRREGRATLAQGERFLNFGKVRACVPGSTRKARP